MVAPARAAAFRALSVVSAGRMDLGDALARARDPLTDRRDRALATDLVTGTLRWRGAIDYQLQRLISKPLDRLDQPVLDSLRLAVYQLLYLERVPVSAAVNDAVESVKAAGLRSAAAFANAVLRRFARERQSLAWPLRPAALESAADLQALIAHLAVIQSHPAWLVERWIARYGAEVTEQWLIFNNIPPALTLAPNRSRGSRDQLAARLQSEGIETVPTPVAPYGLVVRSGRPLESTAYREGAFVIQDEASQIVPELVQAAPGLRVLDACASPGGKTLALAAQTANASLIVANDVRSHRVRLLAETLRRCTVGRTAIVHSQADRGLPFLAGSFDRVLVDAPCSGLGTVRRDPDIRWRRQPDDLPLLGERQLALLLRVGPAVKAGGRLVYATCSSEPEENEQVVANFVDAAPHFSVVALADLPALAPAVAAMATAEGYLRTAPSHGLEGFFGAVLERRL